MTGPGLLVNESKMLIINDILLFIFHLANEALIWERLPVFKSYRHGQL